MTELIQQLPRHYQQSPQDAELQRALSIPARQAERDVEATLRQLFPSTAGGWGLELWERAYGIPVDPTQPEERRRARVLSKVKWAGTTTLDKLKAIAEVFSESRVEIREDNPHYRFHIWYLDTIGEIAQKEDLEAIINELKPAHLAWDIKYRQETTTQIRLGALPRQGDQIIWKVECR